MTILFLIFSFLFKTCLVNHYFFFQNETKESTNEREGKIQVLYKRSRHEQLITIQKIKEKGEGRPLENNDDIKMNVI